MRFVDKLDELTDGEGDSLDTLEFFLGADKFVLQIFLFVLNILFLNRKEVKFGFKSFKALVEVIFRDLSWDLELRGNQGSVPEQDSFRDPFYFEGFLIFKSNCAERKYFRKFKCNT